MIPNDTKFVSAPSFPLPGQMAATLEDVVESFVTEVKQKEIVRLEDLLQMTRLCPVTGASLCLIGMRIIAILGQYQHPDKTPFNLPSGTQTIEEFIKSNFETMQGSLLEALYKMGRQTTALGFSVAEINFTSEMTGFIGEWRLKSINVLEPQRIEFAGRLGEIDRVIYNGQQKRFAIPYQKLLHLKNDTLDSNSPRGEAQAAKAYPYYKALRLLLSDMSVSLQRSATGVWILKVPSNETVTQLDRSGNPERNPDGSVKTTLAIAAAQRSAELLKNGSVLATDKNNDVQFMAQGSAAAEFIQAAGYLEKSIFLAYNIPGTIFNEGSALLGQSGLNAGHRLILDGYLEGVVRLAQEQILEKIVRPLLVANFGTRYQSNLGSFQQQPFLDPAMASTLVSTLTSAIGLGVLDGSEAEVTNRLRELCGLSTKTQGQLDEEQLIKLLQQQQAQQPPPGEGESGDTAQPEDPGTAAMAGRSAIAAFSYP